MFEIACEEAPKFTRPLVLSVVRQSGRVDTMLGTCMVLNADGWAVTAGHMFKNLADFISSKELCANHDTEVAKINGNDELDINQRRNALRKLKAGPEWVRDWSYWWGMDGVRDEGLHVIPQADLAVAKLSGVDTSTITAFPKFKRPESLKIGTSLVKIGYPFSTVQTRWNDDHFEFEAAELALFPIEGIHTRKLDNGMHADGFPVQFIETSSPGLMGQSGGPTLDREGVVWAVQSMTQHLSLGFKPKVKDGRREVEEHQFLNVGVGVSTATLEGVFDRLGVRVDWVD